MKEVTKNILGSLGCLSVIAIAFYALVTNRLLEFILIYLTFFGILKLIDYSIISKFPKERQQKIKSYFSKNVTLSVVLMFSIIFGTFFFGARIVDGLTSVETLTERIHERSKYKFSGSKCNDGWTSFHRDKEHAHGIVVLITNSIKVSIQKL